MPERKILTIPQRPGGYPLYPTDVPCFFCFAKPKEHCGTIARKSHGEPVREWWHKVRDDLTDFLNKEFLSPSIPDATASTEPPPRQSVRPTLNLSED